jgi:hypothetical protein
MVAMLNLEQPIPILSEAAWPGVVCPDCGVSMRPMYKRQIKPSAGIVMVTYACPPCDAEAFLTVKDD